MKKNILGVVLAVCACLLLVQQVYAEGDSLLRARASVGYSSYAITLSGSGSPDATSQYLVAGGGVTYATGDMYFDASGSISLAATHDWPSHEGDFQRTDSTLTAGYLLDQGWSVFGGYKYGKSEILQDNLPAYKLTFEAYGFFGGASKSVGLENGTSMSFSGALAFMTGDIYEVSSGLNDSGSAVGLSFAAGYNKPLSTNSGIRLRGFYQSYSFSDFTTVKDVQEDILGVEAGYYLNF